MPQDAFDEAARRIGGADLLLIVGTSGVVQPAASLVSARPPGGVVLEINPAVREVLCGPRLAWPAPAGAALPQLAALLLSR